jgi:Ca2+-binding EF-hand superfamily protein
MSTISGVGGASSAWSDASTSRTSAMRAKMFAKVDSDGSGSVDKTELQRMLDHISSKTGNSAGNADELLGKMDSDGNGSLSSDELEAGMKSLMPAPKSTVDFAKQRSGEGPPAAADLFNKVDSDGSGSLDSGELNQLLDKIASASGAATSSTSGDVAAKADAAVFSAMDNNGDGSISPDEFKAALSSGHESGKSGGPGGPGGPPPPGGMPPAGGAGSGGDSTTSSTSSTSSSTDPLDTNVDGVVSAQERAAGELKDLLQKLATAIDTDGDQKISKSEADAFQTQLASVLQNGGSSSSEGSRKDAASDSSAARDNVRSRLRLSTLTDQVVKAYSQAAADEAGAATAASVSLAA